MMKSVLITGASRGIGLEFVRQLCRRDPAPEFVFASCRTPSNAADLQAIAAAHSNVRILEIDVRNDATFAPAVEIVANLVGPSGLNVLINNAGIITRHSVESISREALRDMMEVNLFGPILLTQAFLPLLRQGAQSSLVKEFSVERAAVINMTSGWGSISDNGTGGAVGYRESKAALNMYGKSLSLALQSDKILVLSQNPGMVQTDMTGKRGPRTPQEAVRDMLIIISQATEAHNGLFLKNKLPLETYQF